MRDNPSNFGDTESLGSMSGYPLPQPTSRSGGYGPSKLTPRHLANMDPLLRDAKSGDGTKLPARTSEDSRHSSEFEIAVHPADTRWVDGVRVDDHEDLTPADSWRLSYLIFLALGLALLLPWNVFITASEFFRVKFAGSPYQMNFQNWFSTSYTLTNLVVIAVCISQQHRIKPRPVILITLAVNVVIFMCMTIFTRIASLQGTTFFGLTLAMLTLGAMSSSLMQCALFALVSRFPPLYIQGVLSGQAVAGVVVSIVQLVTAASTLRSQDQVQSPTIDHNYSQDRSYDPTPFPGYTSQDDWGYSPHSPPVRRDTDDLALELRAFAYFLIASVVCILVLGLFVVLQRLPFYRHFLPKDSQNSSAPPFRDNWHLVKATARSIPSLIFTIALLFAVTFSVFPALTAAVQPLNFARIPFVEIHFVLFNIGDWTGRWFSMFPWLRFLNSRVVLFGALSHLVFVPLFLFSNSVFPATVTRLVPVLIRSDIAFFVIVALFGISNGYWGSLAMMTGPQVALDKERAGTVMSFFLVFGMAFGSVLSFGVTALACNCNSFAM
ncbi:hypothetical protein H4R33_001912 [Dimargaris cristalligena]|nr:hypothetical protein H4R33_001912 [Dimargaris cristalligena]